MKKIKNFTNIGFHSLSRCFPLDHAIWLYQLLDQTRLNHPYLNLHRFSQTIYIVWCPAHLYRPSFLYKTGIYQFDNKHLLLSFCKEALVLWKSKDNHLLTTVVCARIDIQALFELIDISLRKNQKIIPQDTTTRLVSRTEPCFCKQMLQPLGQNHLIWNKSLLTKWSPHCIEHH